MEKCSYIGNGSHDRGRPLNRDLTVLECSNAFFQSLSVSLDTTEVVVKARLKSQDMMDDTMMEEEASRLTSAWLGFFFLLPTTTTRTTRNSHLFLSGSQKDCIFLFLRSLLPSQGLLLLLILSCTHSPNARFFPREMAQ